MSGFAGIVHLGGAHADAGLLGRMIGKASRHGDGPFTLYGDSEFAFGHSPLASLPESPMEKQPLSFDGNTWIVGDVRIDARSQLAASLKASGREPDTQRPDIELVLHAYYAWGSNCVAHIIGDFAFAIWNRTERLVFAARDHFGVKPFYYTRGNNEFAFSNDIQALRSHPAVSAELNESSICDYLAFGYNLDEATTCFADIQRIPPGHSLALKAGLDPVVKSFRVLNFANRIRHGNSAGYVDHFLELFRAAISDRLRCDKVAFELSGGLDSTSVAATSAALKRKNPRFSGLAITSDSRSEATSGESGLAKLVADASGLKHEVVRAGLVDDFYAFTGTAQPYAWPFAATSLKFAALAREHSRVLLSGQCGDVLLQGSGNEVLDDWRDHSLPGFVKLRLKNVFAKRSLRAFGLRTLMDRKRPQVIMPAIPEWLDPELLARSKSVERWKELFYRSERYPAGCRAELTFDELKMPFWSHLFESYYHDLLAGIDCRHPFFDLRLIEFFAAIPASQKRDKALLREAMTGLLPEPVRLRQKAILQGDLVQSTLRVTGKLAGLDLSLESCARWIDSKTYRNALNGYANGLQASPFTIMCPISLDLWQLRKQVI